MRPSFDLRCSRVGKQHWWLLASLPLIAAWTTVTARADIIFSNLVSSSTNYGYAVSGSSYSFYGDFQGYQAIGQAFTPGANYTMTGATVAVWAPPNSPSNLNATFDMYLFSDNGGVPGTLISTLGTDLDAQPQGNYVSVSSGPLALATGSEYWLVLGPYSPTSFLAWNSAAPSSSPTAFNFSGDINSGWTASTGTADSQFEIDGTPAAVAATPEPASFTLLLTGLAAAAAFEFERRGKLKRL